MVTPTRESLEVTEIDPRPIRVVAAEAVKDLDASVEAFERWGVRIPPDSRLHQAREILVQAINTGALVPIHRGDVLGLRALETSFDYSAIAMTLPQQRVTTVRQELEQSIIGPLDPPDDARGPAQLQSQFIVRAALVRAGLNPRHETRTTHGVAVPDLLLENGLSEYAIEVKRPKHERNVVPRMLDAHRQLSNYGLPGAILMDLTDCLRSVPAEDFDVEARRVTLDLYDTVFITGSGHRPGFSNIMVVGTFARVAWTSQDVETHAMVTVHTNTTIAVLAYQQGSLADHRARWIRTSLERGFERLYRTLKEVNETLPQ
jgi:hypothetical protein